MKEPLTTDPDNIPETLCLGRVNLVCNGPLAFFTFTHVRPKAGPLIDNNVMDFESVVRVRVVTGVDNLVEIRDLIDRTITSAQQQANAVPVSSSSKPN